MSFDVFRCLLMSSDVLWCLSMSCDAFWCLSMSLDVFWCVPMSFDVFRLLCLLIASDVFWCLSMSFDVFWCLEVWSKYYSNFFRDNPWSLTHPSPFAQTFLRRFLHTLACINESCSVDQRRIFIFASRIGALGDLLLHWYKTTPLNISRIYFV